MNTQSMPSGNNAKKETKEVLADDCVLIFGGGPVGLLTAAVLAFYDIPSIIIERNSNTTRYGSTSTASWRAGSKGRIVMSKDASGSQSLRVDGLRWI